MPIILRLDRVMADRKMSLNELSEKVGVANVNLSKAEKRPRQRHPLFHAGGHLPRTGLPAGGYSGISG